MTDNDPVDLTEGQKQCLRMVSQHMTSKEIARELGISPDTVNQRLTAARKKLGVANRREAARAFMLMEKETYEPLVYQPHEVELSRSSNEREQERVAPETPWQGISIKEELSGTENRNTIGRLLRLIFYALVIMSVIVIMLYGIAGITGQLFASDG